MSKRTDISEQIRKYLNGELDALAMHQLEKEAQNDPFLMEAIEGYERTGANQDKNLNEITERLRDRVNVKGKVIPISVIAIAASIFLFLAIGLLWLANKQPEVAVKAAHTAAPIKKPADTLVLKVDKNSLAKLKAESPRKTFAAHKAPAPSATYSENNMAPDANADINIGSPEEKSVALNTMDGKTSPVIASAIKKDSANALNEVTVTASAPKKRITTTGAVSSVSSGEIRTAPTANVMNTAVKGVVKDIQGPLPGATVKIKGTNTTVQTDASGKFALNSVPDKAILDIAFIGYETKEVQVKKTDSLVIAMVPNSHDLDEVSVAGFGEVSNNANVYVGAHPSIGWPEFKKYLKDNKISPDDKAGKVKLSFIVNADNSLSDFKIITGLSEKTNAAAIQLIKNGPRWIRRSDGKPQKVKVRIKFTIKQ